MNVYDSERMAELLAPHGFAETQVMEDADVIVLNTCHIREKAAEKVYSDLGRIREIKEARRLAGKDTIVAVAGCVAQAEGAEIVRRAPAVDLVVGPQSYHRAGRRCWRALRSDGGRSSRRTFPEEDKFAGAARPRRRGRRADGVPHRAGGLRQVLHLLRRALHARRRVSRAPVADVEAEARRLAERGVREITLLGQNVNAYHGAGPGRTALVAGAADRTAGRTSTGSSACATRPAIRAT